jgi:putative aldouronate transport system substrate-binding protein
MSRLSRRRLLAGAAGATALAVTGCSSDGGDKDDLSGNKDGAMDHFEVGTQFQATKPLKFSIMVLSNPGYPYKADWEFFTELTKRTNVGFEPTVVPLSDYNQKRSVVITAGNAPFIIPKTYHPDEDKYIASGAILPVSDYLHLMPNFKDKVAKWNLQGNLDSSLRQADGKIYLLPGLHEAVWQDYTLAVRTDILKKLNISTPNTWDDVHTMLKAMKDAYPNHYPLSDRWSTPPGPGGNALLSILGSAYGTYAGWTYQSTYWDDSAKKFVFTGAMDQYRQTLQYLNTLVTEKLLDPESFTQNDDLAKQKFAAGQSFVISTNAQELVNTYRKDLAKVPGASVAKIPLPIGPVGPYLQGTRLENGIMISSKAKDSKNFVAMMQFIDWLWYSDAGELFARWGVQGTTYTGDVNDGSFKLASDVDWAGLNPGAPKKLNTNLGFANGVFAYGGSTNLLNSQFTAEEKAFQQLMNQRKPLPLPPPKPLNADEREQATLRETALTDHVNQQTLKFILGQRPLSDWDKYVTELKGKNMDQYVDAVNKAYERYKSQHG